ncbi:MAG: hypothetical protein ACI9AR_000335 [Flavobacteriaceae bacterium]|jgi:hypothetical protein
MSKQNQTNITSTAEVKKQMHAIVCPNGGKVHDFYLIINIIMQENITNLTVVGAKEFSNYPHYSVQEKAEKGFELFSLNSDIQDISDLVRYCRQQYPDSLIPDFCIRIFTGEITIKGENPLNNYRYNNSLGDNFKNLFQKIKKMVEEYNDILNSPKIDSAFQNAKQDSRHTNVFVVKGEYSKLANIAIASKISKASDNCGILVIFNGAVSSSFIIYNNIVKKTSEEIVNQTNSFRKACTRICAELNTVHVRIGNPTKWQANECTATVMHENHNTLSWESTLLIISNYFTVNNLILSQKNKCVLELSPA